jgi:hypothetical protein
MFAPAILRRKRLPAGRGQAERQFIGSSSAYGQPFVADVVQTAVYLDLALTDRASG